MDALKTSFGDFELQCVMKHRNEAMARQRPVNVQMSPIDAFASAEKSKRMMSVVLLQDLEDIRELADRIDKEICSNFVLQLYGSNKYIIAHR